MNRSPRVAVALWWRRGWPPTHMRPPPMIPSPPPPSLAFSPASAGAVRGMATRADGFPQMAAAAPRVDLNRGGMQSTPSARTTIRRTLRPRGVSGSSGKGRRTSTMIHHGEIQRLAPGQGW
ncbi:hypothetical protein PVAP13_2NG394900 [Panicum virgatum]|uniref:Uncharacterized protein n=1 Tax=Panicum virgatum TaxID=38727 RepID=A0A8T0VFY6_PANVG|nr:hypothetical protein PVAP13_2NG394900 [Panicum virgatum]